MGLNREKIYLAALSSFVKFGQKRIKILKAHFPSAETAFRAGPKELIEAGIPAAIAQEFVSARNQISPEKIEDTLLKENINLIDLSDPAYPRLLSEIYDPPALLFYKGSLSCLKNNSLGVVGTRKNTAYGEQACINLSAELVKNNFVIISGLALGIDSIAHQSAIDNGGYTVAVLGSGVDKSSIYPSSNRYLAEKIMACGGLIISEFPIGTSPLPYNFPMRNRIISGLSLGILVIEAALKSGALITARAALEQNREVFAVPGSIFSPLSEGPNLLIKQGAIPCLSIAEIMEALDLKRLSSYINNKIKAENEIEERIIKHLSFEPIHIDELVRISGVKTSELSGALAIMEMRGAVKNFGNMKYALL
jgi:DNA processing protein